MNEEMEQAVNVLKNGGIVVFPTDTAYGMGCRIDDEEAVKRLFQIRRRPENKATPVLVSGLEMANKYWEKIPDLVAEQLIKPYWPGALTIVLPCKTEKVPRLVRGNGDTLGLRMPNYALLLEIIKEIGVPIIGTSANFAGEQTPYNYEDLNPELVRQVDFVLRDSSAIPRNDNEKKVSTVIDCSVTPWKILRQGVVKIDFSV